MNISFCTDNLCMAILHTFWYFFAALRYFKDWVKKIVTIYRFSKYHCQLLILLLVNRVTRNSYFFLHFPMYPGPHTLTKHFETPMAVWQVWVAFGKSCVISHVDQESGRCLVCIIELRQIWADIQRAL